MTGTGFIANTFFSFKKGKESKMEKLEKDKAILSETEAQEFITLLEGVKGEGFFYHSCQTWIRRFKRT